MTDRAACTSPQQEPSLWSCPGSSPVIRVEEKEQKVNKIPSFSFSFFSHSKTAAAFSFLLLLASRGIKLETMKYIIHKEREKCCLLNALVDDYQDTMHFGGS